MIPVEEIAIAWRSATDGLTAATPPGVMGLRPVGDSGGVLIGRPEAVLKALADDDAGATPPRFRRRRVHRAGDCEAREHSAYLMAVQVRVETAHIDEYRRWLDEEHGPGQLTVAGAEWFAAYEGVDEAEAFLNVWGLADPAVPGSDEWQRTRDTLWRSRLEPSTRHVARGMFRVTSSVPHAAATHREDPR